MRMRLFAGTVLALMAAASCAAAADLGTPRPGGPGWTGCHIGAFGGLGTGQNRWQDQATTLPFGAGFIDANGFGGIANTDMAGSLAGVQLGCDLQMGLFVVGVQGSYALSNISGTNLDQFNSTWSVRSNVDWLAGATGRLGYAINTVMIYGRAGGAWAHDRFEIENTATNLGTPQANRMGWTAGAGIEWAFAPNWSTFLELDYYGFGALAVPFPGNAFNGLGGATAPFNVSTSLAVETLTVGVNYRF
jgi:outer membrane immunogenic protein